MPYTKKQIAMLHEDAAGKGKKGPPTEVAKKMLDDVHGMKALPPVGNAREGHSPPRLHPRFGG